MSRIPSVRDVFASRALYGLHGLEFIQRQLADSGPAAVTMCLKYLGEMASEGQVGDALGAPSAAGIRSTTIMRYVSGRGIRCTGWMRTPFSFILERIKQQKPALVCWPGRAGQWLIPCGYEPDMQMLVFADPERGRFTVLPLAEAEATWSNQPRDRTETQVVLPLDRVSAATKGHKHPLNRKHFRLQSYNHSTRDKARAEAVEVAPD